MVEQSREHWATRGGFLLAAIGSAIGLGNIWRFPYIAYDNGGGAFLLPYLIALLTAGIPLLIMEYALGHRYRSSPPRAFRRMAPGAQVIGWWQVVISFVIACYYAVIIAWALRYLGFSVGLQWDGDPEGFLYGEFLALSDAPGWINSYVWAVAWPLILVWLAVLVVLAFGVQRGIERANRVFIPLLVILFLVLVIRALTLPGAAEGLDALFTPDWGALADGQVWVAAYGQIFFSLSVGFGIMITYASYLRRRADLTGSALVAGFANSSFEILAGIGVFATLGFMAAATGGAVQDVVESGVGLAFVAFPQIISQVPVAADLFGVLFFASLVLAGLSSLISIVQVVVASMQDRLGMARVPAVLLFGGATAVASIVLFPTDVGLYLLDVVDRFINSYGIALAALVSVVVIAWALRRLPRLRAHADATSSVPLGRWWYVCLGLITPLVLGWMMVENLSAELSENYEGYPAQFLGWAGWAVAGGAIVLAVVLAVLPWRAERRSGATGMAAADDPTDRQEGP